MKAYSYQLIIVLMTVAALIPRVVLADQSVASTSISQALSESTIKLLFRARYEGVDQDGIDKDADALTIKSRITLNTAKYQNFSLGLEVDNVSAFIDDYNSSTNGNTQYPLVVDPTGTDVNQGYLQYKNEQFTGVLGRQRVLHNNQRFVGGVGWRQNEQTYDGIRLKFQASDLLAFDYTYVNNINNIKAQNISGDFHLINLSYQLNSNHTINGFSYILDYRAASNAKLSTSTFGALYKGKFGPVIVNVSAASQSDNGDNSNSFTASYLNIEAGTKVGQVTLLAGYELLGSDNGVGFSTPLATLHKFQGFADKFLGTPAQGVQDIYISAKMIFSEIKLTAIYHDLSSDIDNLNYGKELDLVAAYTINKSYDVLFKFANYSADEHQTDTNKLWLQFVAKF